jgi:hypothetical protein
MIQRMVTDLVNGERAGSMSRVSAAPQQRSPGGELDIYNLILDGPH